MEIGVDVEMEVGVDVEMEVGGRCWDRNWWMDVHTKSWFLIPCSPAYAAFIIFIRKINAIRNRYP